MPKPPNTQIIVTKVLDSLSLPASGSVYSNSLSLDGCEGYCNLFLQVTGSGTLSVLYELSNDNINWSQVATLSSLVTGFVVTSGPAADGKTFLYFQPPVASWLRLKFTETGTANPVVIIAIFGVM